MKKHSLSIQKKILIISLSCILSMCIIISFVSYYLSQNYLKRSLIQSAETNLKLLSDTIDEHINAIDRMVQFLQTNPQVAKYIEESAKHNSSLSVNTYDRISEEYNNNPSRDYMTRLAVITDDSFVQIVTVTYSSTARLSDEVPKLPYFDKLLEADNYDVSTGFITDPFYRRGKQILPVIRPITYQFSAVRGGYLFMEISDDLFKEPFKRYAFPSDSRIFVTIGGHTYLYSQDDNSLTEWTGSYTINDDMSGLSVIGNNTINEIKNENGDKEIFVTTPLSLPGCYISQSISKTELLNQLSLFWVLIGGTLVCIFAIGIILAMLLNRMINVPIHKLRDKMLRVAGGDFERDESIEWEHELGDIGRGINDLSENVNLLMNRRIEDEKQKRDLEYKMLQSQINPHFIYNTLNSIKWMASTQGATGISEMTTALARLLKSISKGTSLKIPIREELSLIEDYFTIQNYRYGGTISLSIEVEDENIYDNAIIKFTLQPIVENAIFHGIEPKGGAGTIEIKASYENDRKGVCIDVKDDGVGMSPEKTERILENNEDNSADFFREIGISNVHRRLKYEFGNDYGITVKSSLNEYTVMSVHLPDEKCMI